MQQLVLDLARVTNQPIPAYSGELADTETLQHRLALGRALLLVERMTDGQIAWAIGEIAARSQQCSMISLYGVEVGKLRDHGPRP